MLSSGRLNRFGTSAWSKPMAFHAKVVRVFTRVLESRRSRHPSESRWHRAVAPGVEVGEITTRGLALSRPRRGFESRWGQTTLTRSLNLLEREGVIERASHLDGRIKAMRLTSKGRRALEVARPLWAQAQDKVLRELRTKAWADAQRRLTHLLHVTVKKRRLGRERRRVRPSEIRQRAESRPAKRVSAA